MLPDCIFEPFMSLVHKRGFDLEVDATVVPCVTVWMERNLVARYANEGHNDLNAERELVRRSFDKVTAVRPSVTSVSCWHDMHFGPESLR